MANHPNASEPAARDRSRFTFRRPFRLLRPDEFDAVFADARRSADRYFTVLFRSNDLGHARLGLVIAKKKVRRAVDRNRVKRLVRDSFRRSKGQLSSVDIVIMARDQAGSASSNQLFDSLAAHWRAVSRPRQP